ncbi:C-type lectin domain family 2 member D-like [Heteronotia binoei]|uniref:C-type lectin domain family 2 member D-like n=1 Tax=Heteronotia binoei TaxID=13085 RepID=UPI00292CF22F|nr:C-type lectin domain family 2 member D-like [Heteronotia binoei]
MEQTRTDPAFECLPRTDEERKKSERAECRSLQNCCRKPSPREVVLLVFVIIFSLVTIVLIIFVSRSPAKDAQQKGCDVAPPAPCLPACPSGWIGYEGKCYFFSEEGMNWTSSQSFCWSHGSSLAVIENKLEKAFIVRYKCSTDHWIGLWKDPDHNWKWADGTELNGTLEVTAGGGDCVFLNSGFAVSSRCYIQRNWICSHHDAYASNKNTSIRR